MFLFSFRSSCKQSNKSLYTDFVYSHQFWFRSYILFKDSIYGKRFVHPVWVDSMISIFEMAYTLTYFVHMILGILKPSYAFIEKQVILLGARKFSPLNYLSCNNIFPLNYDITDN